MNYFTSGKWKAWLRFELYPQTVNKLKPLVKLSIVSRTCLNILTPQDPPSTCWHNPLSVENSILQSDFGHL